MESYGVFCAVNYGLNCDTIPICLKSISDFADKKVGWISKICCIYKCRICKVFDRVCFAIQKSHPLNCRCDTFVNITSPTQLQDGTTYDSNNIIHYICMKSTEIYSEISVVSLGSSSQDSTFFSKVVNFSFTGYEKFLPIFWNPYSVK